MRQRGRAVPPRPVAEIEAEIARNTRAISRDAEALARAAAIQAALATGDPAPVRDWAREWLTDTSTFDAADDTSLMESVNAAHAAMTAPASPAGLAGVEAAAARVARALAALPAGPARERLLATLEAGAGADAVTSALNRLIAAQARRLLGAPEASTI